MLVPPRRTEARWRAAAVAVRLKRAEITVSLGRNAVSGSRLRPSSMAAPSPRADQLGGLMPLPMKRAAKRLGGEAGTPPARARVPSDSSHGRAMLTPTPARNVRRDKVCFIGVIPPQGANRPILLRGGDFARPFVQKLRARDDGFDQAIEPVVVVGQPFTHAVDRVAVGRQEAAAQRIGQQLLAQVIDIIA